jgi:hypothetical protein
MSKALAGFLLGRRRTPICSQARKGRKATECNCPDLCDRFVGGVRTRESVNIRDWTRAEWKLSSTLMPKLADQGEAKALEDAIGDYLADCRAKALSLPPLSATRTPSNRSLSICDQNRCFGTAGISVDLAPSRKTSGRRWERYAASARTAQIETGCDRTPPQSSGK